MWLYYWGMTERQVDLLLTDQPLVVYDHDKPKSGGKGGKKGKGEPEFADASEADVLEAEARWKMKYGGGERPKIDLGKVMKGE